MPSRDLVDGLQRMLQRVEEEERSIIHAFGAANSRFYDYSVVVEDPNIREFAIKVSYLREALSRNATKSMREKAFKRLESGIESGEYEVDEVERSIIVDSIYDLTFSDCIKEENRTEVDVESVLEPFSEELISQEGVTFLDVYFPVVRHSVKEVDQELQENIREFVSALDKTLPKEPTQEDWQNALSIIYEKMVEVDKEARTMVSAM